MTEQQALNVRCALRTLIDDLAATYRAAGEPGKLVISIGQFRRLESARQILKAADAG